MKSFLSKHHYTKWLILFLCWTFYGLFFTSKEYINLIYAGRTVSWQSMLTTWLICAYLWAFLTPPILRLSRRFPLEASSWSTSLPVHLIASCLFSLLQLCAYLAIRQIFTQPYPQPVNKLKYIIVAEFHTSILIYWSVVGIHQAINYYSKFRDRELKASQLETQLAQAQLDVLKLQLNPHFLFNTLNAISVLMKKDINAADHMLVRLSELLRVALANAATHEVALRQELDFLEKYLEIEQTRYQDRLKVRLEIDPEALEAQVPHLILQPLVENAIRYGVARRSSGGLVEVRAARENGTLHLQVRDNGPGLDESAASQFSQGVGLSNIRARLRHLYGEAGSLELHNVAEGGLEVTTKVPFKTPGN
ncbi:MAG: histidine kinase [Acidobacteriota bacterium]